MRLIDADKINFEEVFGCKSDFAKDIKKAAQGLIERQPTASEEEKIIFVNSPFDLIRKAFKTLYPEKEYRACIEPDIADDQGEKAYGVTIFYENEAPIVAISAELTIKDAAEVFAHELAHVAAGEETGHGEEWEKAFENIRKEYQRIGQEMFG